MTTSALVTPHPLAHPPYITTLALSCSIFPPKHSINFPDIYHISSSTLSCYSPVAPIIRCWVSSHFTWCSLNISSIIHLKYIPVPSLAPYHHHDRHCSPHIWSTSQPPRLLWHFYYVQPLYYAPLSGKFHLSSIFPTQLTLIFTARKTVTIMLAFMRLPTRTDYTRNSSNISSFPPLKYTSNTSLSWLLSLHVVTDRFILRQLSHFTSSFLPCTMAMYFTSPSGKFPPLLWFPIELTFLHSH